MIQVRLLGLLRVMGEASEAKWVGLILRNDHQILMHHGTGERVPLPLKGPCATWTLRFGSNGMGLLTHPEAANTLVSSLLKHRFELESIGPATAFRIREPSGTLKWHAEFLGSHISRAVKFDCGFISETYHCACRRETSYVYWSLPWIKKFLFPSLTETNWVGKNRKFWDTTLSKIGLEGDHILPSLHAAKYSKILNLKNGIEHNRFPQDWSISTPGLLGLLARWAGGGHIGNSDGALPRERASQLLSAIIKHITKGNSFRIHGAGSDGQLCVLSDGSFNADDFMDASKSSRILAGRNGFDKKDKRVHMHDLLVAAVGAIFKQSREKMQCADLLGICGGSMQCTW